MLYERTERREGLAVSITVLTQVQTIINKLMNCYRKLVKIITIKYLIDFEKEFGNKYELLN